VIPHDDGVCGDEGGPDRSPRLVLLNGFQLWLCGRTRDLPPSTQRLLAYLALHGRPSRADVAGQLWPERRERQALANLRSLLHRLGCVPEDLIERPPGALALHPAVRVDVREVVGWARAAMNDAAAVLATPIPDGVLAGELLPGWYDDWVLLERERLRQLRLHALEVFAIALAGAGRYGEALDAAYCAVRGDPLRESAQRIVVGVHLAEGNVAHAIERYRAFRDLLRRELGLPPSDQMEDLVRGLHPVRARRP
jgi:DNA-binding SARP family transcriptional activator